MEPQWLLWAKELSAIAQIGLTFCGDSHYDRDRYLRIREIAAEMVASNGEIGYPEALAGFARGDGYATPKVDVRAVIFDSQQHLLLVQERTDERWTLPGGWADVNEPPSRVAEREVFEEAGIDVRATRLLAVLDRSVQGHIPHFAFHVYKMFILCEQVGGTLSASDETLAADWFAEDAIPPLSETRVLPGQIARMFALARDPSLPPDFD